MKEVLAAALELVYPPISNREGDWLYALPEVREHVRRSKLYMIAKRPRLYFSTPKVNNRKLRLDFKIRQAVTGHRAAFQLSLKDLLAGESYESVDLKSGEKIIKLVETGRDDEEPLAWFTPDKLLYDHWRGYLPNLGLGSIRKFTTFDLLYVGISKEGDSLTRLFEQGHVKRTKILSQEEQVETSGLLSEEIMIFLFDVVPRRVRIFGPSENYSPTEPVRAIERGRLVADAEKAFTHVLQTKYNEIRYAAYPKGLDGLFDHGLDKYLYWVGEDISFRTAATTFIGQFDERVRASMIVIQGDRVTLVDP